MSYQWTLKFEFVVRPPIGDRLGPREMMLLKIRFRRVSVWWQPWTWFARWHCVCDEVPAPPPGCKQMVINSLPGS